MTKIGRCALVVEDMQIWQEALHEVLVDTGYTVHITATYDDAQAILVDHDIDLAVIDPVLDDNNRHNRDGLRVLQHILQNHAHVHAVVMTSSDPNRIRREVQAMSPDVPILWKDEWDDTQFLAILDNLFTPNASQSENQES